MFARFPSMTEIEDVELQAARLNAAVLPGVILTE